MGTGSIQKTLTIHFFFFHGDKKVTPNTGTETQYRLCSFY